MSDRQSQYAGTTGMRPGQEVDPGRLDRWIVGAEIPVDDGIEGRIARGTAASVHAKSMAVNVAPLAELAWSQVKGR